MMARCQPTQMPLLGDGLPRVRCPWAGVLGKALTADRALALVETHEPDLLVFEPDVAGTTRGGSIVRAALDRSPSLKVIALARSHDPTDIASALESGAPHIRPQDRGR